MRSCRLTTSAVLFAALLAASGCRTAAPSAGAGVQVVEVRLSGFDVLPPDVLQELRDNLPLKPGTVITATREQNAVNMAVEALQDRGYPYAEVHLTRQDAGAGRARLLVDGLPGPLGLFGQTDIVGNTHVDDALVRSRLAYQTGEIFRRSALEASQQRIAALQLFKSVAIDAERVDRQPAEVPIRITVVEERPWRWDASLSYAAGERLGLDVRLRNMNFLGGARRLELGGRISRIDRLAEVTFTGQPLWHPRLSWSLVGRDWSIDESVFRALSRSGQATLTWQQSSRLSMTVGYTASLEHHRALTASDPLAGLRNGMLNAWSVDLEHNRGSGAPKGAPSGPALLLHIEQAGAWLPGTFNYYNAIGEAREYASTHGGRLTWATRVRYGSISPFGPETDIPLVKRFFLGGEDQMRGWSRFELSPLSAAGEPIGGRSLFAATTEFRAQLLPRLRGAIFAEAGNVWRTDWTARFNDLKVDAGPGVRVQTPFGLIRVDLGYQVNHLRGLHVGGQPEDRRWRINIGLGETF